MLGHFENTEQGKEIRESCYELLLLLAEAVGFDMPNQQPEERHRHHTEALRILDRAANLGVTTQAFHLYRARYLAALGRDGEARQERQQARATAASTALDSFLSGNEKIKSGDLEQASKDLENAVRVQPNHFWAHYFLGICSLKRHGPAEARASFNTCLSLRSGFIGTYLLRGFAHAELQQFRAAEEDYDKALQLNPTEEDRYAIYVNRGVMRIRQAEFPEALDDLRRAISSNPDKYEAYLDMAQAYQESNQLTKAVELIDQAIARAAAKEPLYRIRAQMHLGLQDSEAALRDLDQALHTGQNPKNAVLAAEDHVERGRILHQGKRYKQAVAAYEEALALRPEFAEAYRLKGRALLELQCFPEAIEAFEQYFKRADPDVPTYLACAWAKGKIGRYTSAIDDYTLALKFKPDSETFTNRGWMHLFCDAPKLAQRDFEEALQLNPKNAEAYNGRGYARVLQGKYQEGIKDAKTALELGPESTPLLYHAARTFAQAVGKLDVDPTRRSRRDAETGYAYQIRAFELIRGALRLLPEIEQSKFWANIIKADGALDPIRTSSQWAYLESRYSKPAK